MHEPGQHKRRRLARAGLGNPYHVAPGQQRRPGLRLHSRGLLVSGLLDGLHHGHREPGLLERLHGTRHAAASEPGHRDVQLLLVGGHRRVRLRGDLRVLFVEVAAEGHVLNLRVVHLGQHASRLRNVVVAALRLLLLRHAVRPLFRGVDLLVGVVAAAAGPRTVRVLVPVHDILFLELLPFRRDAGLVGLDLLRHLAHKRVQRVHFIIHGRSRSVAHQRGGRWALLRRFVVVVVRAEAAHERRGRRALGRRGIAEGTRLLGLRLPERQLPKQRGPLAHRNDL